MTRSSRSFVQPVHAQGQQPNFQELQKAALGGMATVQGLGLAGVARAADVQQIADIAGYQAGDAEYVLSVAGSVFGCAVLGVILGFAMLRLEQIVTAKE
eukprot:CAMPEP_0167758042 /NCGR_PEP_ID=MMETSP0110_2-20121227/10255_1 /TAXON_ID=629695 /ORGANISM="Gymnochlora sp., Strain CCMP2014" /LENGTH=98 /DNA_ID=CAMNT_0007644287 /DNA_START=388 /DNA_END=684 /DNA_ORIENTATION=+